jgi:carbon-monoxide dehydrogenase large subunit
LLTGRGQYANDFSLPGQAYACLTHSLHAHTSIASIDVTGVIGCPGVLTVLTGSDAPTLPPDLAPPLSNR